MQLEIIPYTSIGDLCLGDSRKSIRQKLTGKSIHGSEEYSTSPMTITDVVVGEMKKIEYNNNLFADFIEVSSPCQPIFMGKNVFAMTYQESRTFFEKIDDTLYITSSGIISPRFGVVVSFEDGEDEPFDFPYACGIFVKGYYNEVFPDFPKVV